MKKIIFAFILGLFVAGFLTADVYAGGDKVRGDEGQGEVNLIKNEDPNCWDDSWCTSD